MTNVSTDYFAHVVEFHKAIGATVSNEFSPLDKAATIRRESLISEEYQEVRKAFRSGNPADLIHELCDLMYVIMGTFVEMGVNPAHGYRAIHDANMSKVGGPKRADGKQLKPAHWKPANMSFVYAINGTDVLQSPKLSHDKKNKRKNNDK